MADINNVLIPSGSSPQLEQAPIVRRNGDATVFQGYGNSHFTHVRGEGFHVTTEIPGLRQGTRITDRHDI